MSWIFLSGQFAYKLKKPVRTAFVDFSTLQARHFFCCEELRLNRRLAPAVYLDVLALTVGSKREMHLGGNGTPVEWIVRMRRLPAALMLDAAIGRRALSPGAVRRVAARLAAFYRTLACEPVLPADYLARFAGSIAAALRELGEPRFAVPAARAAALGVALGSALGAVRCLLEARAGAGMLVEGHGDLRPEHVCLLPSTPIIDCLEFSRALRILDRIDEVAFLALECERLGASDSAQLLLSEYGRLAADVPAPALVHFYQACRASSRALIALRHLHDEKYRLSPHWRRTGFAYLDLARAHALRACQARGA